MMFSHHFQCSVPILTKSENLKIQDGRRSWRHLCNCGCHESESNKTWLGLIEYTNEARFMCQHHVNRVNDVESRGEGSD